MGLSHWTSKVYVGGGWGSWGEGRVCLHAWVVPFLDSDLFSPECMCAGGNHTNGDEEQTEEGLSPDAMM